MSYIAQTYVYIVYLTTASHAFIYYYNALPFNFTSESSFIAIAFVRLSREVKSARRNLASAIFKKDIQSVRDFRYHDPNTARSESRKSSG